MSKNVQWLIRNKDGRVDGPFTTTEVVKKIRTGLYLGEEFISKYPSGRWHPISYDQNFFNILLEVLENEMDESPNLPREKQEESQSFVNVKKDNDDKDRTRVAAGQAVPENFDEKTPLIIDVEPEEKQTLVGKAVVEEAPQPSSSKKNKKKQEPKKKKSKRSQRAKVQWIIFTGVILVVAYILSLDEKPQDKNNRIRLLAPRSGVKKRISTDEYRKQMRRAIDNFRLDTLNGYLQAQDALVSIVERSKNLSPYSFLCMTYRELWSHSFQDEKDHRTIQEVLRRVQKLNPKSATASECLVVSQWAQGRYDDALRIMDAHLAISPGMIFFYQMTGDIYASRREYETAAFYFSKVRELWTPPPVWSKALLQEARMYRKRKVFGTAVKLYRELLRTNKQHAVAQIELGIMEFDPYQNISRAQDNIRSGLSSKQAIPKMIESEAYVALGKMSFMQGDKKQALEMAQKAFSIDSSNEDARELIVNIGGIKALNAVTIDNVNMVYLGEQYMKMGNYTAAQAEFRAAFEANRRNAFAALRAGQALWRLNQSNEAIAWVKKSVVADPTFIRSYIILADYMSARYDYLGAIEVLKGARSVKRNHHGIYRGFALIELRRRNYGGAIKFAQKALDLYDTDIDSLLILAKAYYYNEELEEAFKLVQRIIELDPSNEEAHATNARVLVALQGTESGIEYLRTVIAKFDKISYMRALGEILAEEERTQDAIQAYYDALAKNPKDKPTLMALGRILQREKDFEGARDYLLEAATIDPSDAEPLFMTGQLYLDSSNKASQALKQFKRVIEVNKKYPLAHYYAGLAHFKLRQYEDALSMAEQERKLNPELPEPYILAADSYFKMKQYSQCTQEYQKALLKGLNTADGYIKLARCQRLSGALDAAATMLDEANRRESGNPNIYKEQGALYYFRGDYIKAVESYKKYLQLNPQAKDKRRIKLLINKIQRLGE